MHSLTLRVWRIGLCIYLAIPAALLLHSFSPSTRISAVTVLGGLVLAAFAVTSAFWHTLGFRSIEKPRAWQSGWLLPAVTTIVFAALYHIV